MKKVIGWCVAILVIGFVVYFNVQNTQKARDGKFVIAANIPLSGSFAQSFKSGYSAFKAGIADELKAQGLPPDSVYIDEGDNKLNTTEAITIFNKQEMFGFDAYYVAEAGTFNAILPKLKQSGKPVLFISTTEKLFKQGAPNTIRLFAHLSIEMAAFNRYVERKQAKNIMFVGTEIMVAEESYNDFIKPYCQDKGLNCYTEFFEPSEKDFRTIALKVKDKNPDLVFVYASPNALYQLAREFKTYQLDLNKILMSPVFFVVAMSDEFSVDVKKDFIFICDEFYTTKVVSKSGYLEQDWVKNYIAEFGKIPHIYFYENGRLLARGFAKYGKNLTADNLMDLTPYKSIFGDVEMDKENKELIGVYDLAKVNDKGEIEKVEWEDIK